MSKGKSDISRAERNRLTNYFSEKPVLNNAIFACLDKCTAALYGVIKIVFFAKILTKNDFGLYALANVIAIFGITFCDLSVGQALIHHGAGKRERDFANIACNSLVLKLILFVFVSAAVFFAAPLISAGFKAENLTSVLKLIPSLIFATLLFNTATQMFNAKEQIRKMFYLDFCLLLLFAAGVIIAHGYNFISDAFDAVLFLVIVRLISSFVALLLSMKTFIHARFRIDVDLVKKLYVYARSSFANSLGVFIFSKTDVFMLGLMLNPAQVAVYVSAAVVTTLFMLLNEPMNIIVLPIVSKLHHQNTPDLQQRIRKIYKNAAFVCFSLSLPVSVLLLIFPREILSLVYGQKYIEAVALVRLFAAWGLILPFCRCAASIINGVGKPQVNARYTWLSAALNIFLNLPLIYYLKTIGAALASVATCLALLFLYVLTLRRWFHITPLSFLRRSYCPPKPFVSVKEKSS